MTETAAPTAIRHEIEIGVPIDHAFAVFHEQWDKIKPHDHNPQASPVVESVFEPRVGGHLYDRLEDGSESRWSRVLVFEPPHRFVISWDIDPNWRIETDPDQCSEIEVTFTSLDASRTRVELEHRNLDRHGEGWENLREGVSGADGWPLYLQRFAAAAG
ncbi:SRPBCC family protein [Microlunatus sp. Gsoil 973]|uniref:SRPBCC family protein n=1 Tax=Microlunatus sp. Gsoil 973 TaxID=2672569 RepID=UPI0012B442A7|nr:SRPBCC family protein [Microlunatus sp. Gsoil 973]QGN31902.1 ATPase [Microlunatus sp. Gsoil 973]